MVKKPKTVKVVGEKRKPCIPVEITYEWFFNRRPSAARRTRRGDRW
jgi:hypothetical protein